MVNTEATLAKLERLLSVIDDSVTKKEFEDAVEILVSYVKNINSSTLKDLGLIKNHSETSLKKIKDDAGSILNDLKKQVNQISARMESEHASKMAFIDRKIASVKDGEPGEPGVDGSPDTPIEIIEKIESVQEKDKLVIEAIKGLRQELDELKKTADKNNANGAIYVGGGTTGGGKTVKVYDLTSQLDGVLKTFALPAFWRVHTVDLSSFPNALRPTVDFTTDAGLMTITFTSEINAATSLATGQTCIVTYSE